MSRDSEAGREAGLEDLSTLLDDLSLEEKIGQLVGTWIGSMERDISLEDAKSMVRDHHLGTVAAFGIGVSWYHDPHRVAEVANELQRVALEETSHGIPLFIPVDAVHGHGYVDGATVFPHGLGIAATRNTAAGREIGEITAREMRATGATVNYGPTADVVRDVRWGRTYETMGESPYLCAAMIRSVVEGLETPESGAGVAATPKHFPAYGDPASGEDTGAVDCSRATLEETFLPPFRTALEAGASMVMPCYNAVNRVPAHASEEWLTEFLRREYDFDGAVVSDWGGVDMLHEDHRIASDRSDAARQSIDAGLDIVSIGQIPYVEAIRELVDNGELSEDRIDASVERIIGIKRDLGLFDDPYVDIETAGQTVGATDHRAVALDIARQSQTLLKNDGVLPLAPDLDEVLVCGPNADSLEHQFGGWSVTEPSPENGVTIKDGIEAVVSPTTTVTHVEGAGIAEEGDVHAAVEAAADASLAVVVLGENWYFHEFGPQDVTGETGSFPSRTNFELPDHQLELLQAVHATGTPTVLVMVTGRPLPIEWAAEELPAILMSYFPGSEGGRAVAETLVGDHNPSGRLPVAVPRSAAHLPEHFDHLAHPTPIGDDEHPPTYDPRYPFGHGLSYTEFSLRGLAPKRTRIDRDDDLEVTLTAENRGDRDGRYTFDLFLRDELASRVRPVKQHVGFGGIEVPAGEVRSTSLTVPNRVLGVPNGRHGFTVEPGSFTLTCDGATTTFDVV